MLHKGVTASELERLLSLFPTVWSEWIPSPPPCISKGCCVTSVPYSAYSSSLLLSAPLLLVPLSESREPTLRNSNAGISPMCSVRRRARMDDFEAVLLKKGTYFLMVPSLHSNFSLFRNGHCYLRTCGLYCTCSRLAPINTI